MCGSSSDEEPIGNTGRGQRRGRTALALTGPELPSASSSTSDTEPEAPSKRKRAARARKLLAKTQLKRPKALAVVQRPKVQLQDVRWDPALFCLMIYLICLLPHLTIKRETRRLCCHTCAIGRLSKKERRIIAKERKLSSRTNTVKKYLSLQKRFQVRSQVQLFSCT